MWEFIRPSSQAFSRISCGHVPSRSYSQATGRISFTAKSCAISRSAFCSSVSVKSTTVWLLGESVRLTGQSTHRQGYPGSATVPTSNGPELELMQDALPIVIVAVVVVAAVIGLVLLARGKGVYDDIRAGDFVRQPDPPAVRDAEIAQMRAALAQHRGARA